MKNPSRNYRKFTRQLREGARDLATHGRAFWLEVASFALTLKFSEAPEAAAAAKANFRRADRLDGRPFRTQFDARFELDLTPVSNSIGRPFRTPFALEKYSETSLAWSPDK